MAEALDVSEFLKRRSRAVVVDVRSPAEFERGRIRDAHSLPLFNNEERAAVGTTYKQVGRDEAMSLGLRLVGPKLEEFGRRGRELARLSPSGELLVHCWRGGMRSASMAWLFETTGLAACTLIGGYKGYRRRMLETLEESRRVIVIGGKTGVGKTELLHELARHGEQTIDLEDLAQHRGSTFGALGFAGQPTNEQFENDLAEGWAAADAQRRLWLEDESQKVGRNFIPNGVYAGSRASPLILIESPLEERISRLTEAYGHFDHGQLIQAMERIRKRLGADRTRRAVEAIEAGDLAQAIHLALDYYDRTYAYTLDRLHTGPIVSVRYRAGELSQARDLILDAADSAEQRGIRR